ncbi:hypothetical protein [Deinococcus sp.]|uniref:hypothetical protein n=1 Tax=Deinococcus sp. TaxID=47478 RepID=UPI003C7E254E
MFNLTVERAHTFYVGTNGWLVHNCPDANEVAKAVKTVWGWTGTPSYTKAQKVLTSSIHRDTLEAIGGKVPTQAEAEALAQSVGGSVVRAEFGHPPDGISTHLLDHILIELPGGRLVTINVTKVVSPYGSK